MPDSIDPSSYQSLDPQRHRRDISTRAMMEYLKPLMSWLEEQNKGRQIGWHSSDVRVRKSEIDSF
jgi:hypothetical protein